LKIAILYFLALSPTSLQKTKPCRRHRKKFKRQTDYQKVRFLSAVGYRATKFLVLSAISLKIFIKTPTLRTAYLYMALILANASLYLDHLENLFELILLRNGKFYSLDKIHG
jgi:hypothetical protein